MTLPRAVWPLAAMLCQSAQCIRRVSRSSIRFRGLTGFGNALPRSPLTLWPDMIIDLHCHTSERSDDSQASLRSLAKAARAAGLDGLCITDHDAFWPLAELIPIARESGILLVPGCEINTDAGHVLVFGLEGYRFGHHHPEALAEDVRAAGGAMVLAHPYRRTLPPGAKPGSDRFEAALDRALENPLVQLVDAIEVTNGRGSPPQNAFAALLAERARLPGVGASDAHDAAGAGKFATQFERRVAGVGDLARELAAGRVRPWRMAR